MGKNTLYSAPWLAAVLFFTAINLSAQAGPGVFVSWVQKGASYEVLARAIVARNTCPSITLDKVTQPMRVRALPRFPDFPVLSCEIEIPAGTVWASIEDQPLALPNQYPTQLVVWGDTGCRMASGVFQACNDPDAWPVAKIAATAAATQPDLIIHTGDLHYREDQCPTNNPGCAGSPYGFGWDVWSADFFTPAQSLLAAAPWVFVRGNHEACDKAWEGWFRFLDPRPYQKSCQMFTDPYSVMAGDLQLIIFDSSASNDTTAPPALVAQYTPQYDLVRTLAGANAWLLHHHPFWGINQNNFGVNTTLQTSSDNTLTDGVQLVLSGHIHHFQELNFDPPRQPQLIVGNSGDNLHPLPTVPIIGFHFPGATVSDGLAFSRFGFTNFYLLEGVWYAVPRDVDGNVELVCSLYLSALRCQP